MRLLGLTFLLALFAACGPDDSEKKVTVLKPVVGPEEAVKNTVLHLDQFLTYRFCEQTYPRACNDLPTAYVLPREGTEAYRIVFFNNQEFHSTWAIFDYVTYDPETDKPDVVGQFQWRNFADQTERNGKPLWDIPE